MSNPSTQILTQAVQNKEAFGRLYDHYYEQIFNYACYRTANLPDAEDVTARIFEKLLNNLKTYDPQRGPFEPWLFTIARNEVSAYLRRSRLRSWLSLDILPPPRSTQLGPESQIIQNENEAELLTAIQKLAARERDLLGLKFAVGLNNRQIAAISGLSESNVGVILYRTFRKLRLHLSAEEYLHEGEPER